MPCYDPRCEEEDCSEIELKLDLDIRTAQLCTVLALVRANSKDLYDSLPSGIKDWHKEHIAFDIKRTGRENAK